VRIVASQIVAAGTISVVASNNFAAFGSSGGRVRIEADILGLAPQVFLVGDIPSAGGLYTTGAPGQIFLAGAPGLRIARIGGIAVPLLPNGSNDVTLPANLPNPVSVEVAGNGIPLGTTIAIRVTPTYGAQETATTPGLAGALDNSTASASVNIPAGSNVVSASATFTIAGDLRESMRRFAQGEPVERIRLEATLGQAGKAYAVTTAGREFELPDQAMPLLAALHR
jgi:hypothetical protein